MTNPIQSSSPGGVAATANPDPSALSSGGANSSSTLPDPPALPISADSVSALAVLLLQSNQADEASAKKAQQAADTAEAKDDAAHVAAMRAKADADHDAALADAWGEIAGGAFDVASGAVQLKWIDTDRVKGWTTILEGDSKIAPGLAKLISLGKKNDAEQRDADAAQFDADAKADLRHYDEAQSEVQSAEQMQQKIQQFLEANSQVQNSTLMALAKA